MNIPLTRYWSLLSTYLRPQWRRVALLSAVLLCNIGLQLLNPQILRGFIDTAQAGGAQQRLILIALLFLGVALLIQLLSIAETYLAENVGWTATNSLRADLTLHCLHLDPDFHAAHTPGAMIERIDGDVTALGNFFSRFVVYVLGNALLLAGVLVLLYRIDARVGAALTLFVLVTIAAMNRMRGVATSYWAAARQASADLIGFLEERIAGAEDLRSSGAVPYAMRGLYQASRQLLRKTRLASVIGVATGGVSTFLFSIGTVAALALGAYLYLAHAVSIGTVYLIFYYTQMLTRPIEQLSRQIEDLQQAGAGIVRVGALLETRSAIQDGPGVAWPSGALAVEFDGVCFGYAAHEPVLRDVSFQVRPGTVLGVLGRTGSGKTTLTRLLFRLYDPQQGAIRLQGHDLREARVDELRRRIGIVTQEIQLFHARVRDNLTLFDPTIPDERILDVLAEVGLWEWYQSLSDGLETMLASGGGLSAGQAQLLAFVRVFLEDPGVVILDEASSRLDPATERRIERAVDRLLQGRTAIIIAHRLATLERADDVLVLEQGRIAELGPRTRLRADPASRYAALLRAGLEEAPA
jgi:ABC-type multidrug transport system fused ATPase/permease subunit